ncbi:MAG: hypothetical protein IPM59_01965 [Chloracidobacterium sp.]|nr:hypothetical protein [Chloracidobacterium sp.]
MPTSICPECSEEVYVDAETEQGDHVACEECGAGLVVAGLDPIELDLRTEDDESEMPESDGFDSYDFDDGRY